MTLKRGDVVKITAGKYRDNGEGIYLRKAGLMSAAVKVKGDYAQERTLRLSSLEPITKKSTSTKAKKKSTSTSKAELLEDIKVITKRLNALQMKVNELED